MEKIEETQIKPFIFKTLLIFFLIGMLAAILSGCSNAKTATITEKRDTVIKYVTDRSFSVKDSFKIQLDSFGIKEIGILNAPIERISGREIVHDTLKIHYNFKDNTISADYQTRPDTVFTEIIKRDKTESVIVPRPWGEIIVYILAGLFGAAIIILSIFWRKLWR